MEKENETIQANLEINEQLEDGKVHASAKGETEAQSANLEMQDRFRGEKEKPAEGVSPAFVYNPAVDLNPEDEK